MLDVTQLKYLMLMHCVFFILIINTIQFSTVFVYFKKKTRLQVKIRHSVTSCKCVIYITSAVLCIRGQYSLCNYLYLETSQRMTHCFKCSLHQHIHFSLFICVFAVCFNHKSISQSLGLWPIKLYIN